MQQGFLGSGFGIDLAVLLLSALLEMVPNRSNSSQDEMFAGVYMEYRVCVCEPCRRSLKTVNIGQSLLCRAVLATTPH